MLGPITRLHHHAEKQYSQSQRILTGVASGYIGGDAEVEMVVAPLGSPRAQLLLAEFAEKADTPPDEPSPASPPLESSFWSLPLSGSRASNATGSAPTASAPASPVPPPSRSSPELPATPSPIGGALEALAGPVTPPGPPPLPPVTTIPPPGTPDPPPVVIPVVEPTIVTPAPEPDPQPSPALVRAADPLPSPAVTTATTVPEPATWASMLAGFALAGAALRRRRLAASLGS